MEDIVLDIHNVCKKYHGKSALDQVSFAMARGEVVGLVGHNGAGKSTLMGIITRLIPKYEGKVSFLLPDERKPRIGAMIEEPAFIKSMTGLENLKYCLSARTEKFDITIVEKYIDCLDFTNELKKKTKTYSVGALKKLDFIQAIYAEPDFLILDEPMNGLDPAVVIKVREIIKELSQKGITILVSSHQLSEISKICNRVLFLSKGKIVDEIVMNEDVDEEELEKIYMQKVVGNVE